MKKVFALVWSESRLLFTLSLLSSIGCAVLQMVLLNAVAAYVSHPVKSPMPLWLFAAYVIGAIAAQVAATMSIGVVSNRIVRNIRKGLAERVLRARTLAIEELGDARLFSIMQEDVLKIANTLPNSMGLARDAFFTTACLIYLGWLSPVMLAIMFGVIAIGALTHWPLQRKGGAIIRKASDLADRRIALLRNLIQGLKQLKSDARLRKDVIESFVSTDSRITRLNVKSLLVFTIANTWAVGLLFVLVGAMIYSRLTNFADPELVSSYTLVIFFLLNPLQGIVSISQSIGQAGIALDRLTELRAYLDKASEPGPAAGASPAQGRSSWQSFELRDLHYAFSASDVRQRFALGPVNVTLRPGEVLFIVGGNGSGKTTLSKIINGLYSANGGAIIVGGEMVTESNLAAYRDQIGGVPNDYCLFDGLAGTDRERFAVGAEQILRTLRLDHVVRPEVGFYAQSQTFSSGEKRRAALFLSSLEDKSLYIFDEFAADQDPEAKSLFYKQILPDLKRRGKFVIVITHDDRYFDRADQLLVLERGMPPLVRRQTQDTEAVVAIQT